MSTRPRGRGEPGRLRVLFVVESGTDVRLVEGLAERFALTVLARRIRGGVEISHDPRGPVTVQRGPSSFPGFASQVFTYIRARRREFDFILIQSYGAAALAAHLAGRGAAHALLVCSPLEAYYRCRRGQHDHGKPFRAHELVALSAFARVNARLAGSYIVLSRHLADVVRAHGARCAIHEIPVYGVDTSVFAPRGDRVELRRRRGLPLTGDIVFFSSRIAPEKDGETLLRAFRQLRDNGRDVHLLHRSGGYRRFLADAERHGVRDRVIATDAVHPERELPFDYAASNVCVQASRAEGLGFSALEALACEVPVVAAKVGGLAETIEDGVTGWTYPAGDASALAAAVDEALTNRPEASRRAVAGRRLVRERFERMHVFDELEACIKSRVRAAAEAPKS